MPDTDDPGSWEDADDLYDEYDEDAEDFDALEAELGLSADDADALMALIDEYGIESDSGLKLQITTYEGDTLSVFVPWEMAWDVYDLLVELEVDFDYEVVS